MSIPRNLSKFAANTNETGEPDVTDVTGTLAVANGGTGITAFGTGVATALGQNVTGSGGAVLSTKAQVKTQAASLLLQTDWVELGDVTDPENPPYLENKAEFTTYRAALRTIAVNPPVEVTEWPEKPEEIWSA